MALPRSLLQYVCSIVLFVACAQALKFDLQATSQSHDTRRERCIRNFVAKDTLVVVTATVSGSKGDGMRVNMHVSHNNTWLLPPPPRARFRFVDTDDRKTTDSRRARK